MRSCIHREVAMKRVFYKAVILAAVVILSVSLTNAVPSDNSRDQKKVELQASEALTKLKIPLQRDSRGVVRWIETTEGEFSDEAMPYLAKLASLEWLEIGGGSVSAAGVAHLKDCSGLRRLYIHDIKLNGDELAWLAGLTKLEALSLQRTGIDGKVLKNLRPLGTLTVLNLSGNNINSDDMEQIASFKALEVLALADTKVTGAGIAKLEGMRSLNELNIKNCDIFDSDIECFLSMPNLRIVYAEGCRLSDMAIQLIISRFPMLAIFR
jgi:Leucine-rich repeat (LRR) protein